MGQQVNIYKTLKFQPGAVTEGWGVQGEGRTYYVNHITGSSGADGLSWNSAFDQLDNAITASEAFRQLSGRSELSTNNFIRNTIIMQGVHTPYEVITALPLHCAIIGLGDFPLGMGQGMVMIGAASATGITSSAVIRGLDLYNLQIQGNGDTYDCMSVTSFYRSRIEGCTFIQNSESGNTDACLNVSANMNSLLFRDNTVGVTNSNGRPDIGLDLTCTGVLTNNWIEHNIIFGVTYGIKITATTNDNGTVISYNTIGAITDDGDELDVGIQCGLYTAVVSNYITAADAISEAEDGQTNANMIVQSGDGDWETEIVT